MFGKWVPALWGKGKWERKQCSAFCVLWLERGGAVELEGVMEGGVGRMTFGKQKTSSVERSRRGGEGGGEMAVLQEVRDCRAERSLQRETKGGGKTSFWRHVQALTLDVAAECVAERHENADVLKMHTTCSA